MKISTVTVGSYGNMRDRIFQIQPGMNVFYGPNEAGKSTLRSFITMTMFPKAGLKYPVQKGSDSGSVNVTLEEGRELIFERSGKKCSGLGSELCSIDDKEYITIYSMSPEDLRDVKGIEKGDIRNRFLTIPGGADLPGAYDSLNEERTILLPDLKRSDRCEIAQLISKEHDLKMRVRELQNRESGDNHYSELVSRKKELEGKVDEASSKMQVADSVRTASHKYESRKEIIDKINVLEAREKELIYADGVDEITYNDLDKDVKRLDNEVSQRTEALGSLRNRISGYSTEAFIRNRKRIDQLDRLKDEYDMLKSIPSETSVQPAQSFPVVTIAGAAVVAIGISAAIFANPIGGGIVVALGLIVAFAGIRMSRKTSPVAVDNTDSRRIGYIENTWNDVMKDVGLEPHSFHSDIELLVSVLKDIDGLNGKETDLKGYANRRDDAKKARNLYLSGFGGEVKFRQAVKDAVELGEVRSKLSVLRESIDELEFVNVDTATADNDYKNAQNEHSAADRELAAVDQALKDIREDMSVEDAITAWSEADSAVYSASYRWARLMIEKIILDKASTNAYGNHRPDVLRRADEYLSCMTGGRYSMNTDPRVTEISIVENGTGTVKLMKECSSGLEDQVKLSLKMGVSLSLSKEKPPVILDDILLTSDTGRKKGACEALALLSKDIQVLYFTCDRETRDLMEQAGATVHEV